MGLGVSGQSFAQRTLPEGTALVTQHLPAARSVTVLVIVRVGSRHEVPGLYGASHHLEHMLFKGTSTRFW